jgi:hypothetical protein
MFALAPDIETARALLRKELDDFHSGTGGLARWGENERDLLSEPKVYEVDGEPVIRMIYGGA